MKNKCLPKGPLDLFLAKKIVLSGGLYQALASLAEGSGTELADPYLAKLKLTEEHSGGKGSKQKTAFS